MSDKNEKRDATATIAFAIMGAMIALGLICGALFWVFTPMNVKFAGLPVGLAFKVLIEVAILVVIYFSVVNFYKKTYTVVPPNQVHVIVTGSETRDVFQTKEGFKSAYYYIALFQQRVILPLENVKLTLENVNLHDLAVAKFKCDVVCWIRITNPLTAAERLGNISADVMTDPRHPRNASLNIHHFPQLSEDITAQISAIARSTAMQHQLLDLMRDRHSFSKTVEKEIDILLEKWGLELVALEILDFDDADDYNVIANMEAKRAKEVEVETRQTIAEQEKIARIKESDAEKAAKEIQATNRFEYRQKEIDTERKIALAEQQKEMDVQVEVQKVNEKKIEAEKVRAIGQAQYEAEAEIKKAEGERTARIRRAEGEAQSTKEVGFATAEANKAKGNAEADILKAKALADAEGKKAALLAEATGKDKLADAMKKMNDSAIDLEKVYAERDVQIAQAKAMAEALQKADIKIISTGEDSQLLGGLMPVGGKVGGNLLTLAETLGIDLKKLLPQQDDE